MIFLVYRLRSGHVSHFNRVFVPTHSAVDAVGIVHNTGTIMTYPYSIQRGEKRKEKEKERKNLEDTHATAESCSKRRSSTPSDPVGNKSGVGSAVDDDSPTCFKTAAPAGGDTAASSTGAASS
jgi:hypothetical protein